VALVDKISRNSSSTTATSQPSRRKQISSSSLLPHGIILSSREGKDKRSGEEDDPSTVRPMSPSRLLTSGERDSLVYNNMYSLPPPDHSCISHSRLNDESQLIGSSSLPTLPQSSEGRRISLLDYGKNPIRHPDSTLSGETLTNVNNSLEHWLCRLADTCPLDETGKKSHPHGSRSENEEGDEGEEEEEKEEETKKEKQLGPIKKSSLALFSSTLGSSTSLSVLESIYDSSGITEKFTPLPLSLSKRARGGGGAKRENLIQQLVLSNHRTKSIKEPTQPLANKTCPNRVFVPK
jgi:hypothetical protein